MIAAAVIGIAVLGGGGYFILRPSAPAAIPAENPAATAPAGPASQPTSSPAAPAPSGGGSQVQPMSKAVNPAVTGGRMPSTAPATQSAPAAAGPDAAALVAKWAPQANKITSGQAETIIRELEPVLDRLSGEQLGNGRFAVGLAYLKLEKSTDGCSMLEQAKPLLKIGWMVSTTESYLALCK